MRLFTFVSTVFTAAISVLCTPIGVPLENSSTTSISNRALATRKVQCTSHMRWIRECIKDGKDTPIIDWLAIEYFTDSNGNDAQWLTPDASKQGTLLVSQTLNRVAYLY